MSRLELIREELIAVARHGETVGYAEVAAMANLNLRDDSNELFGALIGIDVSEHAQGRPMLTAVVVSPRTGMPGAGFFATARRLGRLAVGGDADFWRLELGRVHAHWRSGEESEEPRGERDESLSRAGVEPPDPTPPPDRARKSLRGEFGAAWDTLCLETQDRLVEGISGLQSSSPDSGRAVFAYWCAIETEWTRRLGEFARERGWEPETVERLQRSGAVTKAICDGGAGERELLAFTYSRSGQQILRDARVRDVLDKLRKLRNRYAHPGRPVTSAEAVDAVTQLRADGLLVRYLAALGPARRKLRRAPVSANYTYSLAPSLKGGGRGGVGGRWA